MTLVILNMDEAFELFLERIDLNLWPVITDFRTPSLPLIVLEERRWASWSIGEIILSRLVYCFSKLGSEQYPSGGALNKNKPPMLN